SPPLRRNAPLNGSKSASVSCGVRVQPVLSVWSCINAILSGFGACASGLGNVTGSGAETDSDGTPLPPQAQATSKLIRAAVASTARTSCRPQGVIRNFDI